MGLKAPKVTVDQVKDDDTGESEGSGSTETPESTDKASPDKPKKTESKPAENEKSSSTLAEPAAPVSAPAVKSTSHVMTKGGKFEDQMADQGFEGLEVGFYSYTTVKLANEGRFETGEGVELGKSLKVKLMESKRKFVFNNSEDENVAEFSYDRLHNTKGELLQPIFDEWAQEGGRQIEKKYLDVTCAIIEGELAGEIVILSVSPSGVAKFTGYVGKLNYAKLDLREVVTECYVGSKVTTVPKPFYPWAFRLVK